MIDLLLHNLRTIGTHHCDETVGEEAADEIERLRADVAGLREDALRLRATLINVRLVLQVANTTPNGPICDTIWYSNNETLFDYIDAALAARKGEAC